MQLDCHLQPEGSLRPSRAEAMPDAEGRCDTSCRQEPTLSACIRLDTAVAGLMVGCTRLVARCREGDISVVYYAGHGAEEKGVNFLIGVDTKKVRWPLLCEGRRGRALAGSTPRYFAGAG